MQLLLNSISFLQCACFELVTGLLLLCMKNYAFLLLRSLSYYYLLLTTFVSIKCRWLYKGLLCRTESLKWPLVFELVIQSWWGHHDKGKTTAFSAWSFSDHMEFPHWTTSSKVAQVFAWYQKALHWCNKHQICPNVTSGVPFVLRTHKPFHCFRQCSTFFYTPCLMCIAASLLLKPCCTMRTGPYLEHCIVSWSSEFANVFVRRQ
jgi:hypothetical protein